MKGPIPNHWHGNQYNCRASPELWYKRRARTNPNRKTGRRNGVPLARMIPATRRGSGGYCNLQKLYPKLVLRGMRKGKMRHCSAVLGVMRRADARRTNDRIVCICMYTFIHDTRRIKVRCSRNIQGYERKYAFTCVQHTDWLGHIMTTLGESKY